MDKLRISKIEILIIVVILAVLAAVVIPNVIGLMDRAAEIEKAPARQVEDIGKRGI